ARTESSPTQSGTKQGGPSRDHWAELGRLQYKFACNDCTFLDELHRATLEKKIIVGKEETLPSSTLGRFQDL
ncbi:MAG: hypothetical protein WAN75_00505, partial [Xanthobacteraceae bacterium]